MMIKLNYIMNRVLLNNESICSVAIDESLLQNWIKDYKEMRYNIV